MNNITCDFLSLCIGNMANASAFSTINFDFLNQAINRYAPIPLLFFGTVGNILNILVFTRKTFRNNICVMYFLASTIFDSLIFIVGLLPRLLNGFHVDPSQYSAVLCKLRFFLAYFAGYAAAWFISLACVERYLSSSPRIHRRQMITMKRAYLSMIAVVLMGFIFFGEQFYCIDINQQLLGAPQSCYQLKWNISCQIGDSLIQFIVEILTPAVLMLVFGFLIFRNVRQQRRRINVAQAADRFIPNIAMTIASHIGIQQQPINLRIGFNNQPSLTKMNRTALKRDAQLITMLLVQVSDPMKVTKRF